MLAFLSEAYPWIKMLHIVSMVAWMAGLFYLPRIFVYHAEQAAAGTHTSEVFKVMERKLHRFIMRPAMISTWIFGLLLLATPGVIDWGTEVWIYFKLATVLLLSWFHEWLGGRVKDFDRDQNRIPGRTYRLMNEIPTLGLIVIVTLVVVRPF